MKQIIECIPNFSEGRDINIINSLVEETTKIKDIKLINYSSDYNHNRSVFTIIGSKKGIIKVAYLLCKKASELVDLNKHHGAHPRLGATDVIPLVPLKNVSINECIKLSKKLSKRINKKLNIPVYLYEDSSIIKERSNLADIRKGEFEGLDKKMEDKYWYPDYGINKKHPTAGVVVVGARFPLIAFNINLNTNDLKIAKKIASIIRERDGGYPGIKAIGIDLKSLNKVQVSINICDYRKTSIKQIFNAVCEKCKIFNVEVIESEIIGLVPKAALDNTTKEDIKLNEKDLDKYILDNYYEDI